MSVSLSLIKLKAMDWLIVIGDPYIFTLGIIFLLSSMSVLAVKRWQGQATPGRYIFRRLYAPTTSPLQLPLLQSKTVLNSPACVGGGPSPSSCSADYVHTFPPSRRHALLELEKKGSGRNKPTLIAHDSLAEFLVRDCLPIIRPYYLDNNSPRYTPTGFSTEEIQEMGDFPAYDVLSGVPLPAPYGNFDQAKALPRPYRPFRWVYHQTMCK